MSERGVFAVDRGVWDHPMFASRDPFSRREAWMWLISEAAWKPHRRRIAGVVVDLARGQLAHSLRHLAECWRWSVKRVRGFLDALTDDAMITTASGTGITVITICKYNEYQKVSLPKGTEADTREDTATDTPSHTRRAHEGHNKESKEYKEKNAAPAANPEADLFRRGREVLGKDAGGLISKLLAAKQKSIPLARAAIEQAAEKENPREYVGAVIRGPKRSDEPNWLDGIEGVL